MKHTITIEIHGDIDPSTLLEIAQQAGQQIADDAETYTDEIDHLLRRRRISRNRLGVIMDIINVEKGRSHSSLD